MWDTRVVLILLRHGQTPNNAEARLQGQVDSPLDDVGITQAKIAGEYIRSRWPVDGVVTSSLTRTRQTVEYAGFGEHPLVVDDRWREIDFGEFDRRRIKEVIAHLTERWREDADYAPDGGESMASMHDRVVEACEQLSSRAVERNVLVVTHATPIKSAAVWALGGPVSMILNMWVNLGTITVLGDVRGEFLLQEFNIQLDED